MSDTGKSGRPRNEASRTAILQSTFDLMLEGGVQGLTVEAVAQRAGVGKTTIYRWWPGKGVLAVEAFLAATASDLAFPQSRSARADVMRQMLALAALYRGPTGTLVRQLIGASQSDPEMRTAFQQGFLFPRREAAREAFARGVASGEFQADIEPEIALDALYGPVYYRVLTSDAPIDDAFIDAIAATVFPSLLA